jgi:3-dehydroquinate synthase
MCLAADLSSRMGWLAPEARDRVCRLIARAGLPVSPPRSLTPERMLDLMAVDKKVKAGRLRLVLLRGIGEALVSDTFDPGLLRLALEAA